MVLVAPLATMSSYLNPEHGRWLARIDTFGVQCLPLGDGHVEAVVQIRSDGHQASAQHGRANSSPVGLGTMQITPVGAFGLQLLHDFGPSRGNVIQARYLAEFPIGRIRIYPELGAEYQDRRYVYYYSGGAPERSQTGQAAHSALNPYVGAMVEMPLHSHWIVNLYLRRRFLDETGTDTTAATSRRPTDTLAALAYRF